MRILLGNPKTLTKEGLEKRYGGYHLGFVASLGKGLLRDEWADCTFLRRAAVVFDVRRCLEEDDGKVVR